MKFCKKISSELKNIPETIEWVNKKIKSLCLGQNDFFDLRICLEEALVNAIKHGNKLNPDLFVKISVETDNNSLTIEIEDEGNGFDVEQLPDPTSFDNLEKLSGRGLFLIKNLMDKVEFLDGGRKIKMVKFFKDGGKDECKRRKGE